MGDSIPRGVSGKQGEGVREANRFSLGLLSTWCTTTQVIHNKLVVLCKGLQWQSVCESIHHDPKLIKFTGTADENKLLKMVNTIRNEDNIKLSTDIKIHCICISIIMCKNKNL